MEHCIGRPLTGEIGLLLAQRTLQCALESPGELITEPPDTPPPTHAARFLSAQVWVEPEKLHFQQVPR